MNRLLACRAALVLLAAAVPAFLVGCSFTHGSVGYCAQLFQTPVQPPNSRTEQTLVEDGTLAVYNGTFCTDGTPSSGNFVLRMNGWRGLPRWVTNATVFLNGWQVRYAGSDDHHVRTVATAITNIALKGGELTWQAGGAFTDDNTRRITWCYTYTLVGWNSANVNLADDDADGACEANDPAPASFYLTDNGGATTALASFPSFLQSNLFVPSRPVAILPRGFGIGWKDSDHHLMQIAYGIDHSESYVEGEGGPQASSGRRYYKKYDQVALLGAGQRRIGNGFTTWDTHAILKDNDDRRGWQFGEIVSGLTGKDLGVVQPPFTILPTFSPGFFGACLGIAGGPLVTDTYVVEDVPYQYAIPALTGWDLTYACSDHHVQELGIWLHDVSYALQPGGLGTLRYSITHVMRDTDDGSSFGHVGLSRVSILGVKPLAATPTPRGSADLVPFAPDAPNPAAFCRQEGTKLRVTVKNRGAAPAGASTTKVTFGNKAVTLPTPPIGAGAATDLLFDIPQGCFHPDCAFQITVDAENAVDEGAGEANNRADGLCRG